MRAPYSLGDPSQLQALLDEAGVTDAEVQLVTGLARFPSIHAWIECDVRGWTLADQLDEAQFELLVSASETELGRFVTADGSVRFAHPALIATATKRAGTSPGEE